ncbi:membrane protein, putative [Paenibacillus sp. JCM 10914]|nr:membrane protein, putative [Paenibacillus sp. JCM 10914]
MVAHRNRGLEKVTSYLIEGFVFGFKVFGPVIPIAAFFYLGDAAFTELFGKVLPETSHGIVNDIGVALANVVPLNGAVGAVTLTITGAITGLDGSGFSGISLAGSIAQLFATAIGSGAATLTALGQVAAIWVGGGTLIPWALIPAAAICGVSPFELARRNLKPVLIGLTVTTVVAMFLV